MLVGETFARIGLDSKQYEKSLDRLENVTKKRALTLGNIFKSAFSFTLGMGLFQGLQVGTGMLKDFIVTAMQSETYEVAMEAVARATGTSTEAIKQQKKAVMDLGIAGQEATQILTRFMQSQLDIRYAAKLTRVAQDAATIAGENSSDAIMRITEAIAKLHPVLLTNYGMTKNLNDIYNDYGRTLGKKANQLSEVEKKQAMLNYILKEGEKIAGSYEAAMGTVGKQLGSMEKLMLPKKLMQEFKTELAGPLIMPAFSVLVDNIIAGIEKMKAWVTDNKEMLRAWGETIKQAVQGVWKTFSGFFGFMLDNAGTLVPLIGTLFKFAFSYLVATTAINLARKATELFSLATLAMKGALKEGPALFQLISRAVGTYRLQLRLASMEGIATTGVIARLRIALYSLWTALGPIGWITIALSLLVSAGIWVYQNWEKVKHYGLQAWGALKVGIGYYVMGIIKLYKFLLGWIPGLGKVFDNLAKKTANFVSRERGILAKRKSSYVSANKPVDEMAEKMNKLGALANKGTSAIDDQSNAIKDAGKATKKAGKEAKGGLMAFDEIHQLMQQTADAADDAAGGIGGLGDVGGLGDIGGLGDLGDLGGIGDIGQVEEQASILGSIWDGVKEKWGSFKTWAGNLWEGVKEKWSGFTSWVSSWEIWTTLKEKWGNFKEWAGNLWEGVKTKWGDFKTWAGDMWEGAKEKWGNFIGWVQEKWNAFWDPIKEKWNNFKIWAGNLWDSVKIKWDNFKTNIQEKWNAFWEPIKTRWNSFKSWAGELLAPVKQKWDSFVTWARGIWDKILEKWNEIKSWPLWKWISDKVDWLKNVFDFKWSLPRIKLPHFSVTWSYGGYLGKAAEFLGLPGIPRFSVSWYKEGGIFNQPSIIGVGESGAEAVVPLDRLTELFASALRQVLGEERQAVAGAGCGDITIPIYIGNDLLETIIVKAQDRRNTRSNGR